jgi:hypothetical protein
MNECPTISGIVFDPFFQQWEELLEDYDAFKFISGQ